MPSKKTVSSRYKTRAVARRRGKKHITRQITSPNKVYMFRQLGVPSLGVVGVNYTLLGGSTYDSSATGSVCTFAGGGVFSSIAWCFRLADVDGVASFVNLFDQYKIYRINVRFIPTSNIQGLPGSNVGIMQLAPDFDDIVAPTAPAYLRQYNTCKEYFQLRPFRISIKPKIQSTALTGGGSANALNIASTWLDCATTTVQHFGMKAAMGASINATQWDIVASYVIGFRNVR